LSNDARKCKIYIETMGIDNNPREIAVVYLGGAQSHKQTGAVTGNIYVFNKDEYKMPKLTYVDECDLQALLKEKAKGCGPFGPERLFATWMEWKIALEQGTAINRL